ncbi:general substrate transporter [Thozetella sp. PMI_491]|nr:general substrate transporter [Thozetella sp. PMI_491]
MSSSFRAWRQLTPTLVFSVLAFLQGAILFGIDTGSFGSLQALPSFLSRFGVQNPNGSYSLPAYRASLMNSLPWIGKISGCLGSEPVIDRLGYKKTMYIASAVQIVGVIIELTSHEWPQFVVGRMIAYSAVGLVENAVPSYNAEVSPAALRGLLSGSIMLVTAVGNLWGAGMSRAYATASGQEGWIIPTSMQLIPAVLLFAFVPFTPESPRWLLTKDRRDEAKASLDRIRPSHDVQSGATQAEVDALTQMIADADARESGTWLDLFRGNYLRRTWISVTLFVIEQTNGNQFVQSYAATFYVQRGLGAMSFTYNMIGQVIGIVGCAVCLVLLDIVGRRHLMIGGSFMCCFLLFLAAGLGLRSNLDQNGANTILSCFMLLPAFTRISASTISFLTGAEIGGVKMRKKTMAFGTACDVAAAFLVTFVTPYLLPNMGVNIGWIFGSVALFAGVWAFFFFPELKGRSLEEVDELFEAGLGARQFKHYESSGAGRLLAEIENTGLALDKKEEHRPKVEEVA